MGDAIKLIGIVIVIIGFALKFDTLATVVVAGIVTGLVGGMSIMDILSTLGSAFLTNRTATLFILTLPVIGLCERMGLRDKAVDFISGIKSATTGRLLSIWQVIRTIASAFSLRIGGHPQFIRPLINPMAQACAIAKYGEVDEKTEDEIKGMAAGTENYGNFFAQNCFMGSSGTLLIVSTLNEIFKSNNIAQEVTANQIALNSIPIAVISVIVGIGYALKNKEVEKRTTTAIFWFILAITFIAGPYIPTWITGACIIVLAILTATGLVQPAAMHIPTAKETRENADKYGYKSFIPPVVLALSAVVVATFFTDLGANNAIGISAAVGLIVAYFIFKPKFSLPFKDGIRLTDNVGTTGILPQVLAALGSLFTAAGVGAVIAAGVGAIIPEGNHFIAVAVYCIGMALFTMIMGNGFAAFAVITVGIGYPFLIAQGANPVVVGALGLTAGYCGTLMTPMAANFNIMPAALLETKSKYAIIISQLPVALIMLAIHIVLMYVLAF